MTKSKDFNQINLNKNKESLVTMFNKKAIICVTLVLTLILANIKISKPHIQKPSIKVIKIEPIMDKCNKLNELKVCHSKVIHYKLIPKYYMKQIPLSKELQKYTYDLCKKKKINYLLVFSIIWHESRFDPNKISKNDNQTLDFGLCQINSCHESQFASQGITNIVNPYQNIKFAVNMLSVLNNKYHNTAKVLMAYGLGDYGMKRRLERGYGITKNAKDVLIKKAEYQKLIA